MRLPTVNQIKTFYSMLTNDALQNELMKFGDNSKLAQGFYTSDMGVTRNWQQLNNLYRANWITGKIIDLIADDMTRAWLTLKSDTTAPASMKQVEQYSKKLQAKVKTNEALKWGRLYGGSIIYMDFGPMSDPSMPVFARNVKQGGLKALQVYDRWRLSPSSELVDTIGDPEYGKPKYYIFEGKKLHHTRCIRIVPIQLPFIESYRESQWGVSVMERVLSTVKKYDSMSDSTIELGFTANMRNVAVDGLRAAADNKQLKSVLDSYRMLADFANNNRISLIDGKDKMESQQYSFAGIPDTIINFMTEVAGAAEVPVTKLWGDAVKGLNNTGEGDIRQYYDSIKTKQESQLQYPLEKLYSFLVPSVLGVMPADFTQEFNNLWQMSDKESADMVKEQAQADDVYLKYGVITPQIMAKELKERGQYKNITDEDIEALGEPAEPGSENGEELGGEEPAVPAKPAVPVAK